MALKMAPMLKQRVLPDNVAAPIFSRIFLGTDTKICGQHVFGRSRHIMRQKWDVLAGKTMTFAETIASLPGFGMAPVGHLS
jgi:hypothetical protein